MNFLNVSSKRFGIYRCLGKYIIETLTNDFEVVICLVLCTSHENLLRVKIIATLCANDRERCNNREEDRTVHLAD